MSDTIDLFVYFTELLWPFLAYLVSMFLFVTFYADKNLILGFIISAEIAWSVSVLIKTRNKKNH